MPETGEGESEEGDSEDKEDDLKLKVTCFKSDQHSIALKICKPNGQSKNYDNSRTARQVCNFEQNASFKLNNDLWKCELEIDI